MPVTKRCLHLLRQISKEVRSDHGYVDVDAYIVRRRNRTLSLSSIIADSDGLEHEFTAHGFPDTHAATDELTRFLVARVSINGGERYLTKENYLYELLDSVCKGPGNEQTIQELVDNIVLTPVTDGVYLYTPKNEIRGIVLEDGRGPATGSIGRTEINRLCLLYPLDGIMRVYQFPMKLIIDMINQIPKVAEMKLLTRVSSDHWQPSVWGSFVLIGRRESITSFFEKDDVEKLGLFLNAILARSEKIASSGQFQTYMTSRTLVSDGCLHVNTDLEVLFGIHAVLNGVVQEQSHLYVPRGEPFWNIALLRRESVQAPVGVFTFIGSQEEKDTNYIGKQCFIVGVEEATETTIITEDHTHSDIGSCDLKIEELLNRKRVSFDPLVAAPLPANTRSETMPTTDIAKLRSAFLVVKGVHFTEKARRGFVAIFDGPARLVLEVSSTSGSTWSEVVHIPCGVLPVSYKKQGRTALIILPEDSDNLSDDVFHSFVFDAIGALSDIYGEDSATWTSNRMFEYIVNVVLRDREVTSSLLSFIRQKYRTEFKQEEKVVDV